MRFDDLSVFIDVATTGSMSRVASERGASQPGISRIIRQLERAAGADLLRRTGRGVELTSAGTRFLRFAEACQVEHEALMHALTPFQVTPNRTISIGVPLGTGWLIIPALQRHFAREVRDVDVNVYEELTSVTPEAQLLERHDVLLTYDTAAGASTGVEETPVAEEALLAVGTHSLLGDGDRPLAPGPLRDLPLVLPTQSSYRRFVEEQFAAEGLAVEPVRELETSQAMLAFAMEGEGVALLPLSNVARERDRGEVIARPIAGAGFRRRLVLKHRSGAVLDVRDRCLTVLTELAPTIGWTPVAAS